MKVAIYARVSDPGIEKDKEKREAKKRQDTDNQLIPLRELVTARGWNIYKEYVEEISAVKKRPRFEEMMTDAFAGKFNVLVVVKIDRIARSVADLIHFLQRLADYKVRFIATSQSIDTDADNAAARLLLNMLSAIAQFERELISERVKAGLARKRLAGEALGRPKDIFDASKADTLLKSGISIREAAKQLGVKRSFLHKRVQQYRSTLDV